jgi:type IV pilus assembly protein PilN
MVRINLLPKEEKARRRGPSLGRPTIKMPTGIDNYIGIVVLVLVIIVLSFIHFRQRNIIKNLNIQIEHTRQELRKLDEVVKLVKELDKKRKDLDARIEIIRDLNRGRFEKSKLLYTMSSLLPDYCWYTNLDITGTLIKLKGITFSNQVIADLMRKMQGSKMFGAVELKNIVGKEVDEHNVMEFDLTSNLMSGAAPAAKTARPPKKTATTKK